MIFMESYKIVKKLHFCYGHRLLKHKGKCAHAHGHNAIVEIELRKKSLDEIGMVYDFSDVKKILQAFIEKLDHRMILHADDPLIDALRQVNEEPFIMNENPTAENIAKLIFIEMKKQNLPITAIRLWESINSYAEYSCI